MYVSGIVFWVGEDYDGVNVDFGKVFWVGGGVFFVGEDVVGGDGFVLGDDVVGDDDVFEVVLFGYFVVFVFFIVDDEDGVVVFG